MKKFLHLMKLEWKMDLFIALGLPLTMAVIYCYLFPNHSRDFYYDKISFFNSDDFSPIFFILFFVSFLTPWTSVFQNSNPNIKEKLQSQEWVFTLPIGIGAIFHRGWIRTLIYMLIVLSIPFFKISTEKDAHIRLHSRSEQESKIKLDEVNIFFPLAELEMKSTLKSDYNYPMITIQNGRFFIRLLSFTTHLLFFLVYLNLLFWMIPKASRLRKLKWGLIGIFIMIVFRPFLEFTSYLKVGFGSPYQALSTWIEWSIPIVILSLILLGLTYLHGLLIYRNREIE